LTAALRARKVSYLNHLGEIHQEERGMLDFININSRSLDRKCDGTSRRDFLTVGSLGLFGGLSLADLLRLRAAGSTAARPKKNTSVILLFLDGGASHLETFDPKMEAPEEFRCLFGSTQTALRGVEFCSLLPKMAAVADKMAIVRSFTHADGGHAGGVHWVKTGYPYPPAFRNTGTALPDQSPAIGSILARQRGAVNSDNGMPNYVRVLNPSSNGGQHDGPAWLGLPWAPFRVGYGTNQMLQNMNLRIPRERLQDRRHLLQAFDHLDRALDKSGTMKAMDGFQQQAVDVLFGKAKDAFDLSREPLRTREKYKTSETEGQGIGLELLLARRLCEAGAGFVSLNLSQWDHHSGIVPGCRKLCPLLDHAVSVFIEDLHARGLEQDILLVITSEFGRTPRVDNRNNDPSGVGRDHWPGLNTLVFVGGGIKAGQVIGTSDNRAAYPSSRRISPQDLMATLFHVLGIDPRVQFVHPSGRPISMLADGKVIEELF
jgi:uncharacterized protein (DUF1501 family)